MLFSSWDGEEALRAATEGSFDLILMDVQMPKMGGLESATALRRIEAGRGVIRRLSPSLPMP